MSTPDRRAGPPAPELSESGAPRYDRRTSTRNLNATPSPFEPATVPLDPGIYLVEASAGTGKTFSLTLTALRLLLDRDATGEYRVRGIGNILVVTFTNAATSELVTRVRAALREAVDVFAGTATQTEQNAHLFALREQYGEDVDAIGRLRHALSEMDTLAIFTIHGFCKRVLDESALESGTPFDADFIENDALWIERVTQDWWRRTVYENPTLAALVVASDWCHDAFVNDMKKCQRWPDTRIEPDESIDDALSAFNQAVASFHTAWDPARAETFLTQYKWLANAVLSQKSHRERLFACATALCNGDFLAGMRFVSACTTDAIRHKETGIFKRPADKYEQVPHEPFVAACDVLIAAVERVQRALRVSCVRTVARQFEIEKTRRHQLDFNDLLRKLRDELVTHGPDGLLATAIHRRYDAALIDEFQDTDAYQFPVFSIAFAKRPLFLVGDPKQAIFAFRGADIFAYRDAAQAADSAYTLTENWRSTPRMVAAVNALFTRQPDAFLYDWIKFLPANAARPNTGPLADDKFSALHWWYAPPDGTAALTKGKATQRFHRAMARECVRLLTRVDDGGAGMQPRSVAVLVRDSFEATAVHRTLGEAGVPCVVAKLGDILHSNEVHELERVLTAVLKPQDGRAVRAALATEMWGKSATEIFALSRTEGEHEWQMLVDDLVALRETWVQRGFLRMAESFIARYGVVERLLSNKDGERRLTNLRQAVELLHTVSVEERLSPEGLLLRIARARVMHTENAERTELRLESDADAVQILTIHKSKGLEYDVVFCPGLWACRRAKPDEPVLVHDGDHTVVFDHGSPKRVERGRLAEAERLAEDLRLVYVALTRAKYRCYVGWGPVKNGKTAASSWNTALGYLLRPQGIEGDAAHVTEAVATAMEQSFGSWDQTLHDLVDASDGAMSLEILDATDTSIQPWHGVSASLSDPKPRPEIPSSTQLDSWRVASFTSLTASHHGADRHVEDGRDVSDASYARGWLAGAEAPVLQRDDFLAFPAGRAPGIALHELFERVDFDAPENDVRALAVEILERERMIESPGDARVAAVANMAKRVLESTLPHAYFALRDVTRAVTLREWTFDLPLGVIERDTLARLFATNGGDVAQRYATALKRIAPERTHGFLTGVIDLAFVHEGKWYVADWKSNHLGSNPAQYEPAALEHEMFTTHYVLQYHLYVTALHRFLRARVPGYTYETHMGGVYYAFLRGIDGTERGWFADRPAESLINALDALMTRPAAPAELKGVA
ncbi:MAG: exodeoxyribonuclease V subunit beta [Gemmatimonadaceae bacterium]